MEDTNTQAQEVTILFTMDKSENDQVRIRETTFKGKEYIDIRIYSKNSSGEYIPTKKGVMLTKDKMKLIQDALSKIEL
jgi:hypothetical protein